MSNRIKLIFKCDEANHVCDKAQYKDASLWEKITLQIHLIYCNSCRKYTKDNMKLTSTIKKSDIKCLDHKCKENMKKELDKAIEDTSVN